MKDDSPDAWVIMLVGNSSGVMKKTAPNVPDAPTMSSIADTTDSVLRSWIYALLLVVLFFNKCNDLDLNEIEKFFQ